MNSSAVRSGLSKTAVESMSLSGLTIPKCGLFRSSTIRFFFNALEPCHINKSMLTS